MKNALILFLMSWTFLGMAQNEIPETQYAAYLKGSKTLWLKSMDEAKVQHGPKSFEYAMARYGLLNNTMASKDEDTFDDNVDDTINLLKEIIEKNPEHGEAKAVLSSVYGLIMGYSPMKGMFYGSKSGALMDQAMSQNPESPLVQKLYAGSKLYTPKMFGGSSTEAIKSFRKSIALFENEHVEDNWLYLDAIMGLAMAYKSSDNSDKAKETLERILRLEPMHGWARSVLAKMD